MVTHSCRPPGAGGGEGGGRGPELLDPELRPGLLGMPDLGPAPGCQGAAGVALEKAAGFLLALDQRAQDVVTPSPCWELGRRKPTEQGCVHTCVCVCVCECVRAGVWGTDAQRSHTGREQVCVPGTDPAENAGVPEAAGFLPVFRSV